MLVWLYSEHRSFSYKKYEEVCMTGLLSLFLYIGSTEASVTSLDCNHGVCPQTQGALTCTITGSVAVWYSPPSDSTLVSTVSSGQVSNVDNTWFTAAFVSNTSGLTTNLSFTATTDKNGTQVRCADLIDTNSSTCTIMISGMSLTVSYINIMYYHYKVLQVSLHFI